MLHSLARLACAQPLRAGLLLAAPVSLASIAGAQSLPPAQLTFAPVVAAAPAAGPRVAEERPTVADVRILIADEKPSAAYDAAKIALEDAPTDPLLFDLAAQAAMALGKEDEALWYTRLGVRELERLEEVPKEQEPLLAGLRERQLELDPKTEDMQELLDDYAKEAYGIARSAAGGKLHVNAADMFLRLRGTASEVRALKELDKVYTDDDASETLFRYGFALPEGQLRGALKNKSPRQIAKEDEEHSDWDNRWEFSNKRPAYRVFTNMGQVTGRQILNAMVQINEFICDAFGMRTTKQECKINVFKDFDSFSETEGVGSPNIGGFFSPSETRISTYDQSTVGRAYDQLWKTLFHEATHQVAQELSNTLLPAWIEEGNACYFEGVELLPTGRLVANLVPESRLRGLLSMLGPRPESYREPWDGVPKVGGGTVSATAEASTKTSADRAWLGNPASRPDMVSFQAPPDASVRIKEVITYFQPGSYSGAFYPWGWGLIYFLRNYEDANGELVYSEILDDYIKSYHKRDDHNVWDRFHEYFIEGAEREGIEDFDDFYGMWAQWIWDLGDLYYGGAEAADPLYHRAMVQIEQKNLDRAAHSLRWALEKRPSDPLILMAFADVQTKLKNKDEAVYAMRRALSWARSQSQRDAEVAGLDMTVDELEDECFARIGKVNKKLTSGAQKADEAFIDQAVALAATYAEDGYPLRGLLLLDEATEMIGSVYSLTDRREELAAEHGVDPRLRRRMAADLHADKWGGSSSFLADGAGLEFIPVPGLRRALWLDELPRRYRLEGTLEVVGGMSITFGDEDSGIGGGFRIGNLMYGWQQDEGFGRIEERSGEEGGLRMVEQFADESPMDEYAVVLEVREGLVKVFIDDELVAEDEVPESDTRGRVGVWGSGTPMTFSEMYLTY